MLSEFLRVAMDVAMKGGEVLKAFMDKGFGIENKGPFDFVTDADKESECVIYELLKARFPEHKFIGEEGGFLTELVEDFVWVVDPLDGTTNYIHRYPEFAVSVALLQRGEPIVGVVYNPVRDELFSATKGGGAFLNQKPMKVSKVPDIAESLLATGFFGGRDGAIGDNTTVMRGLKGKAHGVRVSGSAALNLAGVAAGYFDGCWYQGLKIWDVAAAVLLITEAGGQVTAIDGDPLNLLSGQLIATNGAIHEGLKEQLTTLMTGLG